MDWTTLIRCASRWMFAISTVLLVAVVFRLDALNARHRNDARINECLERPGGQIEVDRNGWFTRCRYVKGA